jgi:hypothetical protein
MAGPNLAITKGISAQAVRTIPAAWDAQWFKRFITDHMQKADYRNATAGNGITITGTEQGGGTISAGGTLTSPVIIPAPAAAGAALTVNGIAGSSTAIFVSGSSPTSSVSDVVIERAGSTANAVGEGPCINLYDTANTTSTVLQNSGGQSELWQYNGSWNQVWKNDASGNFSFTNSGYTYVNSGSFIVQQAGQFRNSGNTGFAGAGMEIAYYPAGGFGYILAYNRTSNVYLPVQIQGTSISFLPNNVARLVLGATQSVQSAYNFSGSLASASATAGSSSALPTAPAGYWTIQINGGNVKIPYYNN